MGDPLFLIQVGKRKKTRELPRVARKKYKILDGTQNYPSPITPSPFTTIKL